MELQMKKTDSDILDLFHLFEETYLVGSTTISGFDMFAAGFAASSRQSARLYALAEWALNTKAALDLVADDALAKVALASFPKEKP
jgi:hypothetical protein